MAEVAIRYGDGQLVLSKSPTLIALRPARREAGVIERTVATYGGVAEARRLGNFQVVNMERSAAPAEDALDQLRREQAVEVGSHVYHTSDDGVPFVPTGNVYIVFADELPGGGPGYLIQCLVVVDHGITHVDVQIDLGSHAVHQLCRLFTDEVMGPETPLFVHGPEGAHQLHFAGDHVGGKSSLDGRNGQDRG